MSIYRQFGVEPIINASGTVTRLGGAPMPSEVLDAFREASEVTVPLEQLQAAASRVIAEATGAEAGLVTSGAAAALTLGAAAIMCGTELAKIAKLPQTDGFANEMLVAREQRSGYDHAVRASGARLVEVGLDESRAQAGGRRAELWEYEAAITENTVGILYVFSSESQPSLQPLIELAHRHNLPVLVDAAAQLPPRENLRLVESSGADLVTYSGGKALRGPQSTGILCGRRDLIASATLQMLDMDEHFELWDPPQELFKRSQLPGLPRNGIGRAMKVSKEEIAALLTALTMFANGEYDALIDGERACLDTIKSVLTAECPDLVRLEEQDHPSPKMLIRLESSCPLSALELCRRLRAGSPPIYLGHGQLDAGILVIDPLCLRPEDAATIARQLCSLLGS